MTGSRFFFERHEIVSFEPEHIDFKKKLFVRPNFSVRFVQMGRGACMHPRCYAFASSFASAKTPQHS